MKRKVIIGVICAMLVLLMLSGFLVACNKDNDKTYKVTFELGDYEGDSEAPKELEVASGSSITLPEVDIEWEGHSFKAWGLNGILYAAGDSYEVTTDLTFVAQWERESYTVTFMANPPASMTVKGDVAPITVDAGSDITIPVGSFSIDGYRFAGWTDDPNGKADLTQGEYIVGNNYTPKADITLYAQWLKGYSDGNGGDDKVYLGDCVVGLGAAVLVRDGQPDKLGFVDRDPNSEEIIGFTFYFEESEGGNMVGMIEGDQFVIRGAEYGMYLQKSYIDGTIYNSILYLNGYGSATVNTVIGDQIHATYGFYEEDSEYGDYMFVEVDPITQKPIPLEDEEGVYRGFYFMLVNDEVIEISNLPDDPDSEGMAEMMNGYYYQQGEESGSFLQYDSGRLLLRKLELDGYGNARLYAVDEETGNKGELISEGTYSGSDDYLNYSGEWLFADGKENEFRFILNAVYGEDIEGEYLIPIYLVFDEAHSGSLTLDGGVDTLEFDGYSGATYTFAGGKKEGIATFGETLCTLHIYDEDGYLSDTLYFNIDWGKKSFTLFEDGYIIDNNVLIEYTGDSKTIIIPDGVTEIADEVFKGNNITSVTIPASVTKIGANAFQNEYTLTRVTFLGIDPSVIEIDWMTANDPFRWPAGDFVIVVPEEHKEEYKAAFSEAWTAAGRNADQYRVKGSVEVTLLPEFQVNEQGVLIAYNRPSGAEELVDLTLLNGQIEYGGQDIAITEIAANVFKAAPYLRSIDLGGVTKIGASAFENCTALIDVKFTNVQDIGESAFAGCTALLGDEGKIALPSIVSIGDSAFLGCTSINRFIFGKNIASLGNFAFKEIAVEDGDMLYVELVDETTAIPTLVNDQFTTGGTFYGNISYRIIVPNIEYALRCYRESEWAEKVLGRMIMTPGIEEGEYFDGMTSLVLNGRAEFDSGSSIWLYDIDGTTIKFYGVEAAAQDYLVTTGSYQNDIITFSYSGKTYHFSPPGKNVTYTSEDNLYTMIIEDVKELSPDTWSGRDYMSHSITVTFNGKQATLDMKGYNSKIINDYLDSDGKHYKFEITISSQGNTFNYKKTQIAGSGDLDFGTSGKIENLTCDDGSVLNLHKLGSSIYIYGHLEIMLPDGSKFTSWGDYGQICSSVEGNVVKFTKSWRSDKYDIVVTIDQEAGTFTYTCTKQ